nr:hypothetical protein Iba_scaffold24770CG0010 [Ipomoea batatas]
MKRKASISSPQSLFGELVCGLVVAGEISFDGFSSVINSWAIATYADWQQQISTFQQFPSGATVCSQLQQRKATNLVGLENNAWANSSKLEVRNGVVVELVAAGVAIAIPGGATLVAASFGLRGVAAELV